MRAQGARWEALESGRGVFCRPRARPQALEPGPGPAVGAQPDPWMAYNMQRGGAPTPSGNVQGGRPSRGFGKKTKHVVLVAGCPGAWHEDEVEEHLRTELEKSGTPESQGTAEIYGGGRFCDQATVVSADNSQMWRLMERWKGLKILCPGAKNGRLWHKVDQELHEAELSRRVSIAVRILRKIGIQHGLGTEANKQNRGWVAHRKHSAERPFRILQRPRHSDLLEFCQEPLAKAALGQ
ncbi:unnamed protein product [Prorocentrum cordatum]|uniref:Uncharacterized protein n=1 Tax=Prorocentrum cordatum TaxID=2364126 RepID=A0ABN9TX17_9DINO|nr:unnamed protein product [Polarella glacialis]